MERLAKIRGGLIDLGLDAVLITDELNQRYATGFAFTDGAVLITLDRAFLITDSRYIEAAERCVSRDITLRMFGAGRRLTELVREAIAECGVKMLGAEEFSLSHGAFLNWQKALGTELHPCQSLFYSLRASKDEAEQRSMRHAQAIAEKALDDVLRIIRPGVTERDIAAEITYRLLKHGGEGNSFAPIAVTGANTSMPHGVPSDAVVREGDFVTMDFGCLKDGYCSDMTRTVAVGYATDEMKNIYDIVLHAQLAGIARGRRRSHRRGDRRRGAKGDCRRGLRRVFRAQLRPFAGALHPRKPGRGALCENSDACRRRHIGRAGIYLPGRFGVRIEDVLILSEGGCEVITKADKELVIL